MGELGTNIQYLGGVGPKRAELLRRELGVETLEDLIHLYPHRYVDRSGITLIAEARPELASLQIRARVVGRTLYGQSGTAVYQDQTLQGPSVFQNGRDQYRPDYPENRNQGQGQNINRNQGRQQAPNLNQNQDPGRSPNQSLNQSQSQGRYLDPAAAPEQQAPRGPQTTGEIRFNACKRLSVIVEDGSGRMELVFFKGIKWNFGRLTPGSVFVFFGKPQEFNGRINMVHPEVDVPNDGHVTQSALTGVYPSSEKLKNGGVTGKVMNRIEAAALSLCLPEIRETLPDGDYRVVFLGNLDANLFEGQGQEAVLQNYGTYFDEARMVMPAGGPLAFTDRNLFYFASADFNQDAPQVDILLQRIVTRHEFQREFVDVNSALDMLVSNIFDSIREQQLTTTVVGGLLHSALLEPVAKALLLDESALLVTQVVGFLTTPLIDALDEALLQNKVEVLTRLENTLKTSGGGADLLGLSNVLNPWAISPGADVTGYFVTEMDFDLQPVVASGQVARTWEDIPMSKQAGEELSVERYLTLILLDGANRIDKIDIKKEGLVGPLVDGVVDDAVLYGRLINIENDLSYEAQPNVAYHTNYAFLNLTLDNYGYSEEGDPLELTAQLDSALVTEELLSSLLGDLGGLIGGVLLRPLLNAVTGVLQETTFALNVYLPDLGIQNIVVEGGWEPVTSSVDGQ